MKKLTFFAVICLVIGFAMTSCNNRKKIAGDCIPATLIGKTSSSVMLIPPDHTVRCNAVTQSGDTAVVFIGEVTFLGIKLPAQGIVRISGIGPKYFFPNQKVDRENIPVTVIGHTSGILNITPDGYCKCNATFPNGSTQPVCVKEKDILQHKMPFTGFISVTLPSRQRIFHF